MNKNMYILPVSATFREIKYPDPVIATKEQLEKKLQESGTSVEILEKISKNSALSFKGILDGAPVIIKHSRQHIPETPVEFFVMADGHGVEAKVLKKLQKSKLKAPLLIQSLPKLTTNIIEDLSKSGFRPLSESILKKKLPLSHAPAIGRYIAQLTQISREWAEFNTEASAARMYFTHALEMLVSYPNSLKRYNELSREFVSFEAEEEGQETPRGFVWSECNPRHILIDSDGTIASTDFAESYYGDQRFMIASCSAHILTYAILGYVDRKDAQSFISSLMKGYEELRPLPYEGILTSYIAMELLHLANGKDFEGISDSQGSLMVQKYARMIIDQDIQTIKQAFALLKKI